MKLKVSKSILKGNINVPSSKSHTIRAAVIAALAKGESVIKQPLISEDTKACFDALKEFGATVELDQDLVIKGLDGMPKTPENIINVKNSGTSLRLLTAVASLCGGQVEIDGDESIRKRPMKSLLNSLKQLGVNDAYSKNNNGCAPVVICGRAKGGDAVVDGITSQFITALLLAAPLYKKDSILKVKKLHEKPYVEMTVYWLKKMGIELTVRGYRNFQIPGNQRYFSFTSVIPGDFSSASFPLVAATICDESEVTINGLDFDDPQGDKKLFDLLKEMGGDIDINKNSTIKSSELTGLEISLKDIPDSLPVMAVLSCFAKDETRLINVPQARIKECDRIKAMKEELEKMSAQIEELKDGLSIQQSNLKGAEVKSHNDHRIAMALTLAGMASEGETIVSDAECINVTYPSFVDDMKKIGANIQVID